MPLRLFSSFCFLAAMIGFSLLATVQAHAATNLDFTVTTSKAVTVDTTGGTPRLKLNVGGADRYAAYVSGSGTAALVFTHTTQAGDLDLDGIGVVSPLELNGGTIISAGGSNPLSPLTFTLPTTANVKINHPYVSMDFTGNNYLFNGSNYNSLSSFMTAASATFTRAAAASYFNSSGTLVFASAGTPRLDYNPSGTARGLLIEDSRINLMTYSDALNNAAWAKTGVTVTADFATAPSGTVSAERLTEPAGGGTKYVNQDRPLSNGNLYTQSFYVRGNNRDYIQIAASTGFNVTDVWANYNVSNGTLGNVGPGVAAGNATITPAGTHAGFPWYRISLTAMCTGTVTGRFLLALVPSNVSTRLPSFTGDGTSGVYIWGAQLELGPNTSSYIQTVASSVTRPADIFSMPAGWFTPAASTMGGAFESYAMPTGSTRVYSFNDGSTPTNAFQIAGVLSGNVSLQKIVGGTTSTLAGPTYVRNTLYKAAGATDAASTSLVVNGTAYNNSATGSPAGVTQLNLGSVGTTPLYNGWIRNFYYYPSRAAPAQLQLLAQ